MDNEKQSLLASVAHLYYNQELTQNQIAERLFTSRSKVSRLLQEAREEGVVEIIIHEPWDRATELEEALKQNFGLSHVRVLNVRTDRNEDTQKRVGELAAYYLDSIINKRTVLGMSWGNTIYHTVKSIKSSKNIPLMVVPIMGAATTIGPERDSLELTREMASAYGGKYTCIYAPLFVSSATVREELILDPKIKESLDLATKANIILTSVGSVSHTWNDYLNKKDLEHLEKQGAIGHIGGRFYDKDGNEVMLELAERTVAIEMNAIRKVPNVVCIASSEQKAEAILGAIKGKLINTLITDSLTAKKALALYKGGE